MIIVTKVDFPAGRVGEIKERDAEFVAICQGEPRTFHGAIDARVSLTPTKDSVEVRFTGHLSDATEVPLDIPLGDFNELVPLAIKARTRPT